jgi:NAD(P)-dependent dehydrogenase (short-subunit alcohol dehydrogenase family)
VSVAGRTALVVGACGGIGRAVVARLLREGATVYAGDLQRHGSAAGGEHRGRWLALDVTSEPDVVAAMATIDREAGRLDILVNAAGIELEKTVEDTTLEEWNHSLAVNVTGTFLTSKHALPLLRAAAHDGVTASIVNFGSYDGFIADPGLAAYCATKGAVHALTRAMACDHGPEGIRVNAVCPGYIDTEINHMHWSSESGQKLIQMLPRKRVGKPEDLDALIVMLASDQSHFVNGAVIAADDGFGV